MNAALEPETSSPCNRNCSLEQRGVCIGCGRTRNEIASWLRLSNEERQDVIERAKQRRKQ